MLQFVIVYLTQLSSQVMSDPVYLNSFVDCAISRAFLGSPQGNQCCVPGAPCEQKQTRPSGGNQRWFSGLHCVADRFDLFIVIQNKHLSQHAASVFMLTLGLSFIIRSKVQFLFSPSRAVWCRKDYSWFCFGGVPCFSRYSLLFSRWW